MRDLTDANVTEAVLRQVAGTKDERQRQIVDSFVRHLHAFIRDVEPSEEEWLDAIAFLEECGRMSDDKRHEYILLSDTIGATILIDAINNRKLAGGTESTVLGPFYREAAPERADIAAGTDGQAVVVSGRVTDRDGAAIGGALLDVWQTAPNGLYEVQDPDQPDYNLRGRLYSGADGSYALRTVKPVSYPIPHDGPVGMMLLAAGRHPYRPAHIHFIVSADGFERVVTQLFTEGDEYLDSDAVFGVKESLVVDYVDRGPDETGRGLGIDGPYQAVEYDFVLTPAG